MGKLITIIGNSGSGKTTLVKRLSEAGGFPAYLEEHVERPFQAAFARDPRFGLANQVDYLLYRAEQELEIRQREETCIQDGGLDLDFFVFTRLFHDRGYLDEKEFRLCERLYRTLRKVIPAPDLVICLTAPLDVLMERKASRQRELDISVLSDLERMNALLLDLRRGLAASRWLTFDSSLEDESYQGCLEPILAVLQDL
jgi:deoxyadenosine/deoxycytidine kinase